MAPLGEGGQATVWKAIDPLEGGAVRALKIFQLGGASPANAERARREAKAIVRSRHPGILACRSLFEDPAEDLVGLVFDYVRGRSLAGSLRSSQRSSMTAPLVTSMVMAPAQGGASSRSGSSPRSREDYQSHGPER